MYVMQTIDIIHYKKIITKADMIYSIDDTNSNYKHVNRQSESVFIADRDQCQRCSQKQKSLNSK